MTILYFITNLNNGRGGHFHSLNHISRAMAQNNTVKIVLIGSENSDIIRQNPGYHINIPISNRGLFRSLYRIRRIIKETEPDVVHAFDENSFNIVRLTTSGKRVKLVMNKCGGPNPPGQYPSINNLVVFSKENMEWFVDHPRYRGSNICVIPNRVQKLHIDNHFEGISREEGVFTFMRICRIGKMYLKSILDSVELLTYLHSVGLKKSRLIIIGTIENENIFRHLLEIAKPVERHITFFTEPEYTWNASQLLYLADAVIGTGRGLMEAASLNKPVLVINSLDKIPVLILKDNFDDAFKTNFSQRSQFTGYNSDVNLKMIERLVKDEKFHGELSMYSKRIFDEFFSTEKVPAAYAEAYHNSIYARNRVFSDLKLILRTLYYAIHFPKKNRA